MAQVASRSPFYERHLAHQFRFHPPALLHVFNGKRLSPPRGFLFGKVLEWAVWRYEPLEFWENLVALHRREAIFHLCYKDEPGIFIDADQQSLEAMRTGNVAADDKLLLAVDAKFNPCSGTLACLVTYRGLEMSDVVGSSRLCSQFATPGKLLR